MRAAWRPIGTVRPHARRPARTAAPRRPRLIRGFLLSLGRSPMTGPARVGSCHHVPDLQEHVLLGGRQRAEQLEQHRLPDIVRPGRRAGRRLGQQVRGAAAKSGGQPAHPVQGELTFTPFQMADLLRRRVHKFCQLPLPESSLSAQLSNPVQHLLSTAQLSPSGERSIFPICCSLNRSLLTFRRCSLAAPLTDPSDADAAPAIWPAAKRTASTIRLSARRQASRRSVNTAHPPRPARDLIRRAPRPK